VVKADFGLPTAALRASAKAGNPDITMASRFVIGPGTEAIAWRVVHILTAGALRHPHPLSSARSRSETALASGVTTLLGGGHRPGHGSNAHLHPGAFPTLGRMLQAAEGFWPVNLGFFGQGTPGTPESPRRADSPAPCTLKTHEDWGTTPAATTAV